MSEASRKYSPPSNFKTWTGGRCPTHPGTLVKVWFRAGFGSSRARAARSFQWEHYDNTGDIIAWRVHSRRVSPLPAHNTDASGPSEGGVDG